MRTTGYELHKIRCLFVMFKGRRVRLECSVVDTGMDIAHKVLTSKPHRTVVLDGKIMLIR